MSKETLFKHITYAAEWACIDVDATARAGVNRNGNNPDFFARQSAYRPRIETVGTDNYIRHVGSLIMLIKALKDDAAFADRFSNLEGTIEKPRSAVEARAVIARVFESFDAEDSTMRPFLKALKDEAQSQYELAKNLDVGTFAGGIALCTAGICTMIIGSMLPLVLLIGALLLVIGAALVLSNALYFSGGIELKGKAVDVIDSGIKAIDNFESNCVLQDAMSDEDTSQHDDAPQHDDEDIHSVVSSTLG